MPAQRHQHSGGVGIGPTPLSGLAPHSVDSADTARQRIDGVEVANHLLLVRNGDAETGDRYFIGQHEKIPELQWRDQKRQIDGVHFGRFGNLFDAI